MIARVPVAHRSPVYAHGTAREADGRWRIFTVGDDRRIRGWDATTGAKDGFSAPAPGPTVRSLLGADLGDMLVSATEQASSGDATTDGGIRLLDAATGRPIAGVFPGHGAKGFEAVASLAADNRHLRDRY